VKELREFISLKENIPIENLLLVKYRRKQGNWQVLLDQNDTTEDADTSKAQHSFSTKKFYLLKAKPYALRDGDVVVFKNCCDDTDHLDLFEKEPIENPCLSRRRRRFLYDDIYYTNNRKGREKESRLSSRPERRKEVVPTIHLNFS